MIALRPNCLLTRYPILLLTAREGLFGIFRPTRWYAAILRAHGYEVRTLSVRTLNDQRLNDLLRQTVERKGRLHLFCDAKIRNDVGFAQLPVDLFTSFTRLQFTPIGLKCIFRWLLPRQRLYWREQILNHAISLAENDLKCSH